MATVTKFLDFAESQVSGNAIDFTADTIKLALLTSTAALTSAVDQVPATILANEVSSSGTGYTATGETLANVTVTNASGTVTIDADNLSWADNASGFSNARYGFLYSGTTPIAFFDLATDRSNVGVTFNININALGIFTIA